jgi:hypothetical protein
VALYFLDGGYVWTDSSWHDRRPRRNRLLFSLQLYALIA